MGFKIGIIADSHGVAEKIELSISFLRSEGCQTIFHLGDICDSFHLAEAADCLNLLQHNRILAIKGNNDHVITCYHSTHEKLTLSRAQLAFLKHLPLVREYQDAVFAHSLPFERELGLSCMIRPLDELQIDLFFRRFPGKLLFRGHGHDPEMISTAFSSLDPQPLTTSEAIDLNLHHTALITCGALTDNYCAIWQPEDQKLFSLTF